MNIIRSIVYGSIFLLGSHGFSGCTLSSDDANIISNQQIEKEFIGFLIKGTAYPNVGYMIVNINWMEPLLSIPLITVNGKEPSLTGPTKMTFDSIPIHSHIDYSIQYNEKVIRDTIDISFPIDTIFYNGVAVNDTTRVIYTGDTNTITLSWKGAEHTLGYLVSLDYKGTIGYKSDIVYQNEVTITEPDSGFIANHSYRGVFSIMPVSYDKIFDGGPPHKEANGLFAYYDIRPPGKSFNLVEIIDGVIIHNLVLD